MENSTFLTSITERDIDLLLLEEFNINPSFAAWVVSQCGLDQAGQSIGAWHSVTDVALGESDLIYLYQVGGIKQALLIENKKDAQQQPRQAERYQERGDLGIQEGKWESFTTCIIAPTKYLEAHPLEGYDCQISYEQFAGWFEGQGDSRSLYRKKVILKAIEEGKAGWLRNVHREVTSFAQGYWDIYQEFGENLHLKKWIDRPPTNNWFNFYPPHLTGGAYIAHQASAGKVKLFLPSQVERLSELAVYFRGKLPQGISVVKAGKSLAIACDVEVIDTLKETAFDRTETILKAFAWVQFLEGLSQKHFDALSQQI